MSDIATLRVRLQADLADIDKMREKVTHSMKQINVVTRTQMREASGSIELIGEQMGVVLPRHLREFVAKLPGVSAAMSAAFNAVAVIALISIVVEAGKKIGEFVAKNAEAAQKLRESQEAFNLTVQKTYNSFGERLLEAGIKTDELRKDHLAALHKQLELIDMQGFDQLEGAFDRLNQAAQKTFSNLKADWLDTVRTFITSGHLATDSAGVAASANRFNSEYSSLLAQGKGAEAQGLLNSTQQREERIYALMDQVVRHRANPNSGATPYAAINELRTKYGISAGNVYDFQKQYLSEQTYVRSLEAQQNIAAQQRQTTSLDKKAAVVESNKASASDLLQALETRLESRQAEYEHVTGNKLPAGQVVAYWNDHVSDFGRSTKEYEQVIQKLNAAVQEVHASFKQIAESAKKSWRDEANFSAQNPFGKLGGNSLFKLSDAGSDAHDAAVRQITIDQAKLNESLTESSTRYAVATGQMSRHDAALAMAAAHQQAFNAQLGALSAQLDKLSKETTLGADDARKNADAQAKVRMQIAQLQAAASAQHLEDLRATESASDQLFDHLRQGAQNTSQKIAEIMGRTVDGLNDEFVGAMFGDHTNFSRVFQQQGRSLAKVSLQWMEGSLLGKHGSGNKGKIGELQLSATDGALNVHLQSASSTVMGGSSSTSSSAPSFASSIPGVTAFGDSLKNSTFGKWLSTSGGKYIPGTMQMAGGLASIFDSAPHARGAGSGVQNALNRALYHRNTLSRWLGGLGQMTSAAGGMMFAGAGGLQGLNDSDAAGKLFGGRLFGSGGIFDSMPGFASGGSVYGGMPILVGENGPEVWTPPSHGHITANRDLSGFGSGPSYVIDARGTDPALTRENVARAIAMSNTHAVNKAQRQMVDRQRRTPR